MRRIEIEKRPNATRLVQSQGLVYSTQPTDDANADPYWPDDRYYSFTGEEIELLEQAGTDVFNMCCEAADYLVQHPEILTSKMAIPAFALSQIVKSWDREPTWGSIYGRFDICFGGLNHADPRLRVPKFYEFNADTPTSVVESAVIQWLWLEQTGHGNDQLNSTTEKLVAAWKRNLKEIEKVLGHRPTVHFACGAEASGEDVLNTTLLRDTCRLAGYETKALVMDDIQLSQANGRFYDQDTEHIDVIFKLYPWEWMVEQEFGKACFKDMENIGLRDPITGEYIGGTIWIEAPYKMMWSNKGLFAVLWDLFKDDPRSKWLLPTYFENDAPASLTEYALKPIFSREGADVVLMTGKEVIAENDWGEYGKEGYIVQELAMPPKFEDEKGRSHWPVLGLWFVDGEVAGMGIREDKTAITANGSMFIPHSISDGPVTYERKPIPDIHDIEATLDLERYNDPDQNADAGGKANEVLSYIQRVTSLANSVY